METLNTLYNDYIGLSNFVQQNYEVFFGCEEPVILVQVFSGHCEKSFLSRITMEILTLIPSAIIIGSTTSGEIINGQVQGLSTVLSFSLFYHSTLKSASFPAGNDSDFQLGRKFASEIVNCKTKIIILFATESSLNSQDVLNGIHSLYPDVPVSGGVAGSNSLTEQSFLICNHAVIDSGIVGIAIEGNISVNCYYYMGWQPIGKEMTITKAAGARVYTIDHIPAFEIYRKYLGLGKPEDFRNVIEYPLIVERHGIQMASTPYTYYNDESIGFAAKLLPGEKVRLSFGHVGMISKAVNALCQTIKRKPVESIFVYSCECHRGFLQELCKIETEPLQEIAATAGFFTYGEFFHTPTAHQLLNATMTILILSESTKKLIIKPSLEVQDIPDNHKLDNVVLRNSGVMAALTHLVNTVTSELVDMNQKLQYLSLHDSLTGLFNRTFFEQELQRFSKIDCPLGIIMCDLDCLKIINDVKGHAAGDRSLRLAAQIITKNCDKNTTVARIGGDEFAVLIPNASLASLQEIHDNIAITAEEQRLLDPELPIYISVGFALKGENAEQSIDNALIAADAYMYRQKLLRRKEVHLEVLQKLTQIVSTDPT